MNVSKIISRARKIAKYTTSNYSDSEALEDLNEIKDEFWAEIVSRLEEDYNWEEWKTASVNGQAEYTLPPLTSTSDGTKALKTVAISYGTTVYDDGTLQYVKAKLVNPANMELDWDYYKNNQSELNPIYYVSDNSIFIAPTPNANIPSAIKMTGIRKISDYTLSTVEADIGIPVDFHRVLVFGLAYEMALDKGIPSTDIVEYQSNYEVHKLKAFKALSMRSE
jgi:hypothetical protein